MAIQPAPPLGTSQLDQVGRISYLLNTHQEDGVGGAKDTAEHNVQIYDDQQMFSVM